MYSTITRNYVTGCILPMCVFSILWPVGVLDENKNLCVSKKQQFYRSSLRHLIPSRKYNRNSWRHLQRAKRKTNRVHLIPHNSTSVFYGNYHRLGIHITYKVTVYTIKLKKTATDKCLNNSFKYKRSKIEIRLEIECHTALGTISPYYYL